MRNSTGSESAGASQRTLLPHDAVRVELFKQLRSNYVWHVIGSIATIVAMGALMVSHMAAAPLTAWFAISAALCAAMAVSYRRLDALPVPSEIDPTLLLTAATGLMVGSLAWFDLSILRSPDTVFLVCVCVMAFSAGSLVNLSPLTILIRASLVPSLVSLSAALAFVGELLPASCIIVFLFIVTTRSLANAQTQFVELIQMREEARLMASHDSLTGLLNRRGFFNSELPAGALILVDIDGFKEVNDTFGHAAGDDTLIEVATRIGEQVGGVPHVCARLGGDEFVLVVALGGPSALDIAERVVDRLDLMVDRQVRISASAGLVACHGEVWDIDEALARADSALYRAKRQGGNRVVWTAMDNDLFGSRAVHRATGWRAEPRGARGRVEKLPRHRYPGRAAR